MCEISILMSIYINDEPSYLIQALESIYKQTIKPDEVVIVFDGPVTEKLINIISDYEIKFKSQSVAFLTLKNKENQGLGGALRDGVKICNSKYIMRMDSDDISDLKRIDKTKKFIKNNPGFSVYGSNIEEFLNNIDDIKRFRRLPCSYNEIIKFSKIRNPMNHVSVCILKDDLLEVGSYESVIYHEDYYLWVKMIMNNKMMINSDDVWVYVRVGNDLISRRKGIKYFTYELEFIKACYKIGFFNILDTFIYFTSRLSVRFLPKIALSKIYSVIRK